MQTTFSQPVVVAAAEPGRHPPLLRSLQWAAATLARPLTVEEIAEVAIRGAMTAVDARAAVVALAAEDGDELRRVHDVGLTDDSAPAALVHRAATRRA